MYNSNIYSLPNSFPGIIGKEDRVVFLIVRGLTDGALMTLREELNSAIRSNTVDGNNNGVMTQPCPDLLKNHKWAHDMFYGYSLSSGRAYEVLKELDNFLGQSVPAWVKGKVTITAKPSATHKNIMARDYLESLQVDTKAIPILLKLKDVVPKIVNTDIQPNRESCKALGLIRPGIHMALEAGVSVRFVTDGKGQKDLLSMIFKDYLKS